MTENVELMRQARESLSGKWGLAIGTFVVYMLVVSAIQIVPIFGQIAGILLAGPFALGITVFALNIIRNNNAELSNIFDGFKQFTQSFIAYLLMGIFILLWSLLLVIPGIIAALSYSQTIFIIADDPTIKPMDAIEKSMKMMDGYKWKLFCLGLRLYGLALLCMLTLGIGFFWLIPYIQICLAKFYEDVSGGAPLPENPDGSLLHDMMIK